jgi:hypothetical protein
MPGDLGINTPALRAWMQYMLPMREGAGAVLLTTDDDPVKIMMHDEESTRIPVKNPLVRAHGEGNRKTTKKKLPRIQK